MTKALNEQINKELYSSYLYLAMAADSEDKGLKGVAHWLERQHQEEYEHAMKIYRYLLDQCAKVELLPMEKPPVSYASTLKLFEEVLAHEKKVTKSIHDLVAQAIEEKDYATHTMLQWFVMEQVEEEASASEVLDKLRMLGDNVNAMFMLDRHLAARQ